MNTIVKLCVLKVCQLKNVQMKLKTLVSMKTNFNNMLIIYSNYYLILTVEKLLMKNVKMIKIQMKMKKNNQKKKIKLKKIYMLLLLKLWDNYLELMVNYVEIYLKLYTKKFYPEFQTLLLLTECTNSEYFQFVIWLNT